MAFDWEEFLVLAERLVKPGAAAENRSAISRAYYFVLNTSRRRAELNDVPFTMDSGSHQQCWAAYKKGPDPQCMQIGIDADRLRELRVRADYKPEFTRLDEEAVRVVKDARGLKERLLRLDPKYPRP